MEKVIVSAIALFILAFVVTSENVFGQISSPTPTTSVSPTMTQTPSPTTTVPKEAPSTGHGG